MRCGGRPAATAKPFLFPNDLCFGPDGALYLTDSGVVIENFAPNNQIRPDYMDLNYDGRVYRVDAQTGKVTKIDERHSSSPTESPSDPDRLLYVNETLTGTIYRYGWRDGSISGPRILFGNVMTRADAPPGWKGPDGMAFDENGLLVCRGLWPGRCHRARNRTATWWSAFPPQGQLPTNVAFALPGRNRHSRHRV